jgi:hypothetical protein
LDSRSDEVFDASTTWGQYAATTPIVKGEPLFPRMKSDA